MKLKNKKAFVTGGSRGIGAAIAKRLAKDGAYVCLTYNNSADKAEAVVADIQKAGGDAFAVQLDAGKPEEAASIVRDVVQKLGGLDILVNNAGIGEGGKIGDPDAGLDVFDKVMTVNVRTPYALTHEAVQHMSSGGRIINISSVMGERAFWPETNIYTASKFAVTGLSHAWAHDLGERNITVNAVQPGPIDTEMNPANRESATQFTDVVPLKRYGHAQEVANLVAFLASDESSYITGATLNVDGGVNA